MELIDRIAQHLDIDTEEINTLTDAQKKALRESTHNLYQMPKYYTDEALIFTSDEAVKHWMYYAGFEYLPEPDRYKRGDDHFTIFHLDNDQDNRIKDYLDIISEVKA